MRRWALYDEFMIGDNRSELAKNPYTAPKEAEEL